ncbi:MAG: class I SAM-dependent methyltransferase [Candidatus Sphingomonas phytovorans]|nr:class I SAM-dependent methyltransferase [Sphingomonas sp.]WEJ99498.1 MAG: class I SAM-dependent methyltransferase [Sphingomonas sp.]
MKTDLRQALNDLPPLAAPASAEVFCKICGSPANLFDSVDFNKHCSPSSPYAFGFSGISIGYHRCDYCEFIFSSAMDDWSNQDFSQYIYNRDYILVDPEYVEIRPLRDAEYVMALLEPNTPLALLDYGSGSGTLARQLVRFGVDAESYDPFSSPVRPQRLFDVITCFEVLEHAVSPHETMADIASMLAPGGCIIFGTSIQPPDIAEQKTHWWYIAPRNGHISIHSWRSLRELGHHAGFMLFDGSGGRAFARSQPKPEVARILAKVGKPHALVRLAAPLSEETSRDSDNGWHGLEDSFRWTKVPEVAWSLTLPDPSPSQVTFQIPVEHEISAGFALACALSFQGQALRLSRVGRYLEAVAETAIGGLAVVKLRTPPPLRPCDIMTSSDSRSLGVAIAIE